MIETVRTKKNGVKVITSSYFNDMKMLRESMRDTDFMGMRYDKTCNFDTGKLKLANAVTQITLWKQGCHELSEYVEKMSAKVAEQYETLYYGEDMPEEPVEPAPVYTPEEFAKVEAERYGKRMKFN